MAVATGRIDQTFFIISLNRERHSGGIIIDTPSPLPKLTAFLRICTVFFVDSTVLSLLSLQITLFSPARFISTSPSAVPVVQNAALLHPSIRKKHQILVIIQSITSIQTAGRIFHRRHAIRLYLLFRLHVDCVQVGYYGCRKSDRPICLRHRTVLIHHPGRYRSASYTPPFHAARSATPSPPASPDRQSPATGRPVSRRSFPPPARSCLAASRFGR